MKRTRKYLVSLLILGLVGAIAGFGTWSAFTATTTNSGNSYAAGSVKIDQHTGATTLYTGTDKRPSDSPTVACVRVTYSGSIANAAVKLYSSSITNGSKFHLKVERGSGLDTLDNTMSCSGFTASSTAFDANMDTLPSTYAAGIDGKASAGSWATDDAVDYRFTISVVDDPTPNAHVTSVGTGSHSFTWEARSA
jgi:hypothetical protein